MTRFVLPGLLSALVLLPAPAADLPADADKRVKEYEAQREAIRKKADDDAAAALARLVADLTALQEVYDKAGKKDDAKAVADRIARLVRAADRAANVLVNGSFEDGPGAAAGGFTPVAAESTDIKGWKVTTGSVDHISTYWKAADGERSLDLNGNEVGPLAQTFKTVKGQKYRVTFALAANPDAGADSMKVKVSAAGKSDEFTFEKKETSKENMGWVIKAWEFTADADETTLEFASLHTDEAFCGPALDDVIVAPVQK